MKARKTVYLLAAALLLSTLMFASCGGAEVSDDTAAETAAAHVEGGEASEGTSYPVVDTGQEKCYDNAQEITPRGKRAARGRHSDL